MVEGCGDYIRNNLNIQAATGSAEHLPFPAITPDVLIYSHVLEHVYDPSAVLHEAHDRLVEKGIIYLEVPDAARYGEFQKVPFADLYFEHINHFDEYHLTALAEANGFKGVETGKRKLDTATGSVVPCIYGLFRKTGASPRNPVQDQALARQCSVYIDQSEKAPLLVRLEALASAKTPVYVWGMSQFGQLLLGHTALGRSAIKALIDSDKNKQGKKLLGKTVLSPEILREAVEGDVVVLTGIGYREQMRDYLKESGFKGSEYGLE
jgi:hypothetical protein